MARQERCGPNSFKRSCQPRAEAVSRGEAGPGARGRGRAHFVPAKQNSITPPPLHIHPPMGRIRHAIHHGHRPTARLALDPLDGLADARPMAEQVGRGGERDEPGVARQERLELARVQGEREGRAGFGKRGRRPVFDSEV